jgi:hypothetical protein
MSTIWTRLQQRAPPAVRTLRFTYEARLKNELRIVHGSKVKRRDDVTSGAIKRRYLLAGAGALDALSGLVLADALSLTTENLPKRAGSDSAQLTLIAISGSSEHLHLPGPVASGHHAFHKRKFIMPQCVLHPR